MPVDTEPFERAAAVMRKLAIEHGHMAKAAAALGFDGESFEALCEEFGAVRGLPPEAVATMVVLGIVLERNRAERSTA